MELGALFVIGSAIRDVPLAGGGSPLDVYWEVIWDLLAPDRFWAWVDAGLAESIAQLASLHSFAEEAGRRPLASRRSGPREAGHP